MIQISEYEKKAIEYTNKVVDDLEDYVIEDENGNDIFEKLLKILKGEGIDERN